MKAIDWLMLGDVVIQALVSNDLLEIPFEHHDGGYITRYLELYNPADQGWGGGVYSPKWISSTYTLLELKYMRCSFDHPSYQMASEKVLSQIWQNHGKVSSYRMRDLCVGAMMINIASYGKIQNSYIGEIVDFILDHQMPDGGWNCEWDSVPNPSLVSSVHTTLSVLEAFAEYLKNSSPHRLSDIEKQVKEGQEFLLKRELFKSLKDGSPLHPDMITFPYPFRWKYDCFRALEYFARINYPYDEKMEAALALVRNGMQKGSINKGKLIPGKVHFQLESGTKGRFNTYRALLILKHFDQESYQKIVEKAFEY